MERCNFLTWLESQVGSVDATQDFTYDTVPVFPNIKPKDRSNGDVKFGRDHVFGSEDNLSKVQKNLDKMSSSRAMRNSDIRKMVDISQRLPHLSSDFGDLLAWIAYGFVQEPTEQQAEEMDRVRKMLNRPLTPKDQIAIYKKVTSS